MEHADACLGAITHYARAELVTVGIRKQHPVLLDRRSVSLIDEGLPSAPYHHEALEMPRAAAAELIRTVRAAVARRAHAVIGSMQAEFGVCAVAVPASPHDVLPEDLDEVLASHKLTMAADGMLYREFLAEAAAAAGLDVTRIPRHADLRASAAAAQGTTVAEVDSLVAAFGREAGAPWRKDHKQAAAAALSLLGPGA